jgi:hypothetical protein
MLKLAATAIAVSSLIATSGAFAVDLVRYEPKVTLPPAPMSAPARSMDILNVTLGMSYADARPMLQRALPTAEIVVPRAAFQLNYKGVLVQTPDFANTVSVQRKQDETGSNEYLVLRFSGPASGNQLIAISRILNYADPLKAPTVSDVRAG